MGNAFADITEYEEKKVTAQSIGLILELVKELKEGIGEIKQGQKTIREELRNIDKLRALKK